jgi:(p)ppGpp synthase/HD superfamily hydrolase
VRLYDDRLGEALRLVAELFATKRRKGGLGAPYVAHLLSVTALVLENGGNEEEAIAAVLHDVLEDIDGAFVGEMEERFGPEVVRIVVALSDTLRPTDKEPWRERKERHLSKLEVADPAIQRVAIADKVHNARALLDDVRRLGDAAYHPFHGGKSGTLWYYRAALTALSSAPAPRLVEQLARIVTALEER